MKKIFVGTMALLCVGSVACAQIVEQRPPFAPPVGEEEDVIDDTQFEDIEDWGDEIPKEGGTDEAPAEDTGEYIPFLGDEEESPSDETDATDNAQQFVPVHTGISQPKEGTEESSQDDRLKSEATYKKVGPAPNKGYLPTEAQPTPQLYKTDKPAEAQTSGRHTEPVRSLNNDSQDSLADLPYMQDDENLTYKQERSLESDKNLPLSEKNTQAALLVVAIIVIAGAVYLLLR